MKKIERVAVDGTTTIVEVANTYVLKAGETDHIESVDPNVNPIIDPDKDKPKVESYSWDNVPKNGIIKDILAYLKKCADVSITTVRFLSVSKQVSESATEIAQYAVKIDTPLKVYKAQRDALKNIIGVDEGTTNVLFLTAMDFGRLIESAGYSDLAGQLQANPLLANVLLKGSTISFVGIEYLVGDLYSNPFSKNIGTRIAEQPKINYFPYACKVNKSIVDVVSNSILVESAKRLTAGFFASNESEAKESVTELDF
jgi:hypothetical protein